MNKDVGKSLVALTVIFLMLFALSTFIGIKIANERDTYKIQLEEYRSFQRQAIEHGFAQYNPTNGNWEWKGGGK